MIIYFRACEKQQTISNVNRYKSISKTEMIKKCWLSVQQSVTADDIIILIHDSVSDSTLHWLAETSNTLNLKLFKVEKHCWNIHQHTVTLIDLLEKYSTEYPDKLHYIVEDDYLHVPDAIRILEDSLSAWDHFAVSYDYPDRYRQIAENSNIMIGPDRHWRTVLSSTMTVVAKGKTWLRHINQLKKAAPSSNDQVFVDIYKINACISPMPGLSTHMTQHHMTPLVNWDYYWELIDV